MDSEYLIRKANALAEQAIAAGNHPFGALLVKDDLVLGSALNTTRSDSDPTAHAEMNLIRQRAATLSKSELAEVTLISSTEPCPMCAGAIYWAGIRKVVFGCSVARQVEIYGGGFSLSAQSILQEVQPEIEIVGPILEEESMEVHKRFLEK